MATKAASRRGGFRSDVRAMRRKFKDELSDSDLECLAKLVEQDKLAVKMQGTACIGLEPRPEVVSFIASVFAGSEFADLWPTQKS